MFGLHLERMRSCRCRHRQGHREGAGAVMPKQIKPVAPVPPLRQHTEPGFAASAGTNLIIVAIVVAMVVLIAGIFGH
jgi:hypothetical protein